MNTALTCELRSRGQARATRFHPASPAILCIEVRRPALRRYAPARPLANVPPPRPKTTIFPINHHHSGTGPTWGLDALSLTQ